MKKTIKTEGFGYNSDESGHHFVVYIPESAKEDIYISEHLSGDEAWKKEQPDYSIGKENSSLRSIISPERWVKLSDQVAKEFNKRLKRDGLKTSSWKTGSNVVTRTFGKELVLLCWAVEDADPRVISTAIQNWLGLAPEERWWLYTMTNAATGHALTGKNKGWRKAVRFALTENPVSERSHEEQVDLMDLFLDAAEEQAMNPTKTTKKKVQYEGNQALGDNRELNHGI